MHFNHFQNTKMWLFFTTLVVVLFAIITVVTFADVPPEPTTPEITVNFAHSGQKTTAGLIAAYPFEYNRLNGYATITGHHVHDGEETDISNRVVYLETGIRVHERVDLTLFGQSVRNSERDARDTDGGYFIECFLLKETDRKVSIGAGNFARNGLDTYHWRFFVRKQFGNFTAQYNLTSPTDLSELEHIWSPSIAFQVSTWLLLDIDFQWIHSDGEAHTQSALGVKVTF